VQTFKKPGLICNDLRFADARIREVGLTTDEPMNLARLSRKSETRRPQAPTNRFGAASRTPKSENQPR